MKKEKKRRIYKYLMLFEDPCKRGSKNTLNNVSVGVSINSSKRTLNRKTLGSLCNFQFWLLSAWCSKWLVLK